MNVIFQLPFPTENVVLNKDWCNGALNLQKIVEKNLHFLSKIQYKPFIKGNSCFKIYVWTACHISNLKDFLKIKVFNILCSHNQFDFLIKTSEKSYRVLNCPLSLKKSLTYYNIPLCTQFVKHCFIIFKQAVIPDTVGCWAKLTFDIFSSLICCLHSL